MKQPPKDTLIAGEWNLLLSFISVVKEWGPMKFPLNHFGENWRVTIRGIFPEGVSPTQFMATLSEDRPKLT